ncbi:MAG: YybS family protein [Syntrophales bacterium]|nr:YybS family protein [Syntrophales bacterium]
MSPLGVFFLPFPVLYFYSKLGRVPGAALCIIALAVVAHVLQAVNSPYSWMFFFVFGALGIILSETLRRNMSIEKTVTISTAAVLFMSVIAVILYGIVSGKGAGVFITQYIAETVNENIELYAQTGVSADQIELVRKSKTLITGIILSLLPALTVTGTMFTVWINILMGEVLFRRRGMWYPDFGDLSRWRCPDSLIWVVIAAAASLFIPWYPIKIIGMNVLIISIFIYMLRGFAVISFYFRRKNIPIILRVTGYAIIFIQQLLLVLVAGLGLADIWFDFRNLDKNKKNNAEL